MKRLTARVEKNLNVTWTDIDGKTHHGKIYEIETDEIHVRENNGTEHAWDLTRFLSNDYIKHIADLRKAESVESVEPADVIKAAALVKRWCIEHIDEYGWCKCPFAPQEDADGFACACSKGEPHLWRDVKNE